MQTTSEMTVAFKAAIGLLLLMKFCYGSALANQVASGKQPSYYRGKVIQVGESNEEIYRHYQDKLQEYQDLAFSTRQSDWNILKRTNDGIEIATLSTGDDRDCPYIRMRATMPTSAPTLYNFMSFANWKIFMPIINPFYQGISVENEFTVDDGKNMVVARKRSTSILGFGRRDFSLLAVTSHVGPRSDGILVSGTISVIAPQLIPRFEGFTRAYQDMVCFCKPVGRHVDGTHQTELTIMLRTDLNDSTDGGIGGAVPMWLVVKTFGIAGSKAMQGLRKVVQRHAMHHAPTLP